jgi:hypothetical protein
LTTANIILSNIDKGEYDLSNEVRLIQTKLNRASESSLEMHFLYMLLQAQKRKENQPEHVNYKIRKALVHSRPPTVVDAADRVFVYYIFRTTLN